MNDELSRLMATFKESLPQEEGLLIRPEIRKALKRSRQIKSAATIASQLPTKAKRGRKKANSSYRNRVGWKAQVLRKVSAVHNYKMYQTPTIVQAAKKTVDGYRKAHGKQQSDITTKSGKDPSAIA